MSNLKRCNKLQQSVIFLLICLLKINAKNDWGTNNSNTRESLWKDHRIGTSRKKREEKQAANEWSVKNPNGTKFTSIGTLLRDQMDSFKWNTKI